ncbi:phage repressor protein/antirepressor Ant [Oceanispirochaeta sp. M2]|nr:phage repressor protein/antirepressor Ant [Oceanispirochaeta sp. M2]NPD75334.1 phage repressor protein/antirepressor Ant [Oceanispirochaeta sp. M1]RDG28827.1 phage repressor protein/antirepressor Ant [Oceanispirochaeta sp. M1]
MKELTKFDFNGNSVRETTDENGNPWFVAKDVSDILGYADTQRMTKRLDDDESMTTKLVGMNMKSILINESGLYNVIIGSKKPEAKLFKKWVTSEVLPSIRKTGGYNTHHQLTIFDAVEASARILKTNDASKVLMLQKACNITGISSGFLPEYSEENQTKSLSDLLRDYGVVMNAAKVNIILAKEGIITKESRTGSRGQKKHYWKIIDTLFGKNLINPKNQKETQPHYYVDKFEELISTIGVKK